MKILQVHNFYQHPGGEDQVFAAEYELLTKYGHEVIRYEAHNDELSQISAPRAALRTLWNNASYRAVRRLIAQNRPDIVHCHNTFPLISPSIYYAASAEGVPVIQTLHNYRLLCASANFFRSGKVCQDCVGASAPYKSLLHRCYRNSLAATAVTVSMLAVHRAAGTWDSRIHTYIALSNFARSTFIRGGLRAGKLVVKPNFLAARPVAGSGDGGYALFLGRICEEKGIRTLLDAWRIVGPRLPLKIAGSGPLLNWGREATAAMPGIEWLGHVDHEDAVELTRRARFLICASLYHESGPLAVIEALACGTPVIAPDLASMDEFVVEGENGLRFLAGDAAHLAERVLWLLGQPELLRALRPKARLSFEQNYTAERNYELLMNIYSRALESRRYSTFSMAPI